MLFCWASFVNPTYRADKDDDESNGENFGVNVAVADFNQDGKMDIVAAMASNGSDIEIITGDGTLLSSFTAFDSNTGVIVAAGNILGDTTPEIIAAPVGSSEITIFDIQGIALNSFTIDSGTVTSLAIAKQFAPTQITEVIQPPVEKTTEIEEQDNFMKDVISAPICPSIETSTNIISGCKGNGAELPEGTAISKDASVSNVVVTSTPNIKGTIGNSEIKEDAIVDGGTFTGEIANYGTLKNINFRGYLLKGGILAGIINVKYNGSKGTGLGNIQDVELAEDAILIGGVLWGTIKGNPAKPATIWKAWIRKGAKISHVRLGRDVKLDDGVERGEGVTYENITYEDLEITRH
ncbi:MAG: FG-GAP repeat protein [Thiotrichaceae bacterium]|nr:FG-GAP repeat protein [Thiotrichaceae bacterium]